MTRLMLKDIKGQTDWVVLRGVPAPVASHLYQARAKLSLTGHGASEKTRWRTTATTATFPEAVRENEEVVPVNAVSTWVLPSGVTVGR